MGTSSSPNEKGEEPVNTNEEDSLYREFEELLARQRCATQDIEKRAQETTWWFTAGLVGFIVLISGDLGAEVMRTAPILLMCLMLTFTLGSGISLILSRSRLLSSKKSLERASEINAKVAEKCETWEASIREAASIRELCEGAKISTMNMMNEADRHVIRSVKGRRWGKYLFNISLVLALLAATSFLASAWYPAVKAWWPVVSTWLSAVL